MEFQAKPKAKREKSQGFKGVIAITNEKLDQFASNLQISDMGDVVGVAGSNKF